MMQENQIQRRQIQRQGGETPDMTPMVDVTFLLLIFFMVTAAFSLQKSIRMPRLASESPSQAEPIQKDEKLQSVELQIDEFGSFLVMTSEWESETPGKQKLTSSLKQARGIEALMQLDIKVHQRCKLQSLVDAIDAGMIANFTGTQVTQVERF